MGVNGTGQRKDYSIPVSTTVAPTLLANVPTTTTTTTTESTVKKNETLNGHKPTLEVVGDEDDIALTHHNDEIVNQTAITNNVTIQTDTHDYYNSTFTIDPVAGEKYWVNLSDNKNVNKLLSSSHRLATTIKLSFDFPYYGHIVQNVTIATGGFLYTGEYAHSWIAATQYIAPLMANFHTGISNDSLIKFLDSGKSFTVQWERVRLEDQPNGGEFTFQVTLHDNGDIVFVYKDVPVSIDSVVDKHHPVKIGIADAYTIDRTIFCKYI